MKSTEFCYWLQGFFELRNQPNTGISPSQVETIRNHLALVFIHDIDPKAGSPSVQQQLQAVHDGNKPILGGKGPNGETLRC